MKEPEVKQYNLIQILHSEFTKQEVSILFSMLKSDAWKVLSRLAEGEKMSCLKELGTCKKDKVDELQQALAAWTAISERLPAQIRDRHAEISDSNK